VSWLLVWAALVLLGLDFFNWGKPPQLYLGLPPWLWFEVALVLLTSLGFFLLTRFAWGDE
jgi:hypothetical protein